MRNAFWHSAARTGVLAALLAPSHAYAAGGAAEQAAAGLEEIIVTATRRDTNLQSTPVAVSAVTGDIIDQAAASDIGDLAKFVPNFSAARITGFNAASFAMRGVGQNNIIVYYESPVGVLVDDFVMPSVQSQLLDTFDVAQVEVLRGPQGTLFGKNTTGGAVVVKTKRPDLDRTSVQVEGLYGKYDTLEMKGAVNLPIVADKVALRVVAGYSRSDGYIRNSEGYGPVLNFSGVPTPFDGRSGTPDGRRIGGEKVWNARVKLLVEPSDGFSSLFQYELLRDTSPTPATINITPKGDMSYAFNLLGFEASGNSPIHSGALTDRKDSLMDESRGGLVRVDGFYNNTNVTTDAGTITNVIGLRRQRTKLSNTYGGEVAFDADGNPLSLFDSVRADKRRTFQEELRFASNLGGAFNFVVGGFYQKDRIDFCSAAYLGVLDLLTGPTAFGAWNDTPWFQCSRQRASSKAAFFEGTFKVNERLTLTGGFRYTWEKKTWTGRQQVPSELFGVDHTTVDNYELSDFGRYPGGGVITLHDKVKKPTYRFSAGYQFNRDVYGYVTYSRGFKAGGYNDNIGSLYQFGTDLKAYAAAARSTRPEFANSMEAGVKTEILDRRLRVNLTGFYVKYKDLQRQVQVPIVSNGAPGQISAFFNAASSRVYGLEGEIAALPVENLTLRAVFGYQNGKYKDYTPPVAGGYDLSKTPLDRTPEWQTTLSGAYTIPVGDGHRIVLAADMNYTGKNLYTQSIASEAANAYLDAHTLVNASITLMAKEDRYFVRLIGQNLTNTVYRTAAQDVTGLWRFALYGRPRFFALQAGLKFGN